MQTPSFTVHPDAPSPDEQSTFPSISTGVSPNGDSDMDEEVDQLVSDMEEDLILQQLTKVNGTVRTRNAPPPPLPSQEPEDVEPTESEINVSSINKRVRSGKVERMPGHTLLPQLRLESILQADGVTGNLSMSKEAMFVLSTATEEFIKRAAQAAERQAQAQRRNLITYRDMACSMQQYQEFMFLRDTIPQPVPLSEAFRRREEKEKETSEGIPAMSSNATSSALNGAVAHPAISKTKAKARAIVNGKDNRDNQDNQDSKENDTAGSRRGDKRDTKGRNSQGAGIIDEEMNGTEVVVTSSNSRLSRKSRHERREAAASAKSKDEESASLQPLPTQTEDNMSSPPSPSAQDDGAKRDSHNYYHNNFLVHHEWPGAFTGPASGFLSNPSSFPRAPPQNPGRTIYSQEFQGVGK